ncbi:sulfite reductase flavoprotein subunit alpha [Luteimonas gilva]|uniref:NADPH--hemoprotein reductase n=1 Tax=Luteimonas gilva TaxID=2572684 RepID=A0A4U5JR20_9GAMM|nr:sulfite reductase flavoprotein subunit alpha [Luteimonas gilva]TKR30928.1 sulfite reductase flavoprotein subunit alpha [Luteimonas gilva]
MNAAGIRASRPSAALIGNVALLAALCVVAGVFFGLHDGDWFEVAPLRGRWLAASAVSLAYFGFAGWIFWRTRPKADEASAETASEASLLLAYASQTGFAQDLAERSATSLRAAGVHVRLRDLGKLDAATLASADRALFVVSTTGEGDAPDPALAFVRDVLGRPLALETLRYGLLALGDREYEHFCGFGHALDEWLRHGGAKPLFDLIEVDNGDEGALRHWQHHLSLLAGQPDLPDWTAPSYQAWRLAERRELNPGSAGAAAYHVAFAPPAGEKPDWRAGDIAEIGPRNSPAAVRALLDALSLDPEADIELGGKRERLRDIAARSHLPAPEDAAGMDAQALAARLQPLPHREYSIASLPDDGALHVLLRRMLRPDGSPGIGSGWLCDYAALGGEIALRIRSNPNFHPPHPDRPLILIGNGTGIAGLRAHLKARVAAGARRNWLLFGERNADRDFFYADEIRRWRETGFIERLDLAFSRDGGDVRYVQDALSAAVDDLRAWIAQGASVYVCGSLHGMAPGVDAVLRQALGEEAVDALRIEGRYRRDVY